MKSACVALVLVLSACGGSAASPSPGAYVGKPGLLGDTWTSDGTSWRQASGVAPPARYFAALAYDEPRHDFVLFGGQAGSVTLDDTWTWDGAKWTHMAPAHKPPPRRNAAMAYDPSHQVVVLHGGLHADQAEGFESSDTWTWNGSDWTEVSAENKALGPRQGLRMVTAGGRLLLFGGNFGNLKYFADVWTWTGAAWSRVDRDPTPPGRGNALIAWDAAASSLFVYGGSGFNAQGGPGALGLPLNDDWLWTGGGWTQLSGAGGPQLSNGNAFWSQRDHSVVVVFGNKCPDPTSQEWTWNGAGWSQAANLQVPARWGGAVAEAPDGAVLLFGGSNEPGC